MIFEIILCACFALICMVSAIVNIVVYWKINKVLKENLEKLSEQEDELLLKYKRWVGK